MLVGVSVTGAEGSSLRANLRPADDAVSVAEPAEVHVRAFAHRVAPNGCSQAGTEQLADAGGRLCRRTRDATPAVVISLSLREWRNWQTRTVQVRVPVRAWGFKSPLAHHCPVMGCGKSPEPLVQGFSLFNGRGLTVERKGRG
jgi:hypothetical protein